LTDADREIIHKLSEQGLSQRAISRMTPWKTYALAVTGSR
jgi:hypothetical protein